MKPEISNIYVEPLLTFDWEECYSCLLAENFIINLS